MNIHTHVPDRHLALNARRRRRRARSAAISVVLACVAAPNAEAAFTESVVLSGGQSRTPSLAMNASGAGFVAWADANASEVKGAVRKPDGTFGPQLDVSGTVGDKDAPSAAIDAQGNVTVAWVRTAPGSPLRFVVEVAELQAGHAAFGAPQQVSVGSNSGVGPDNGAFAVAPTAVALPGGAATVVYHQGQNVYENGRSSVSGASFGAPVKLNTTGTSGVAVAAAAGADGTVTAAWTDKTTFGVDAATRPANHADFEASEQVSAAPGGGAVAEQVAVAVGSGGVSSVVFVASIGQHLGAIVTATRPAGTGRAYSQPEDVGSGGSPRVAVDSGGHRTIVWALVSSTDSGVQASVDRSGGTDEVPLATTGAGDPAVAIDPADDVIVAWVLHKSDAGVGTAVIQTAQLAHDASHFSNAVNVSSSNENNGQLVVGGAGSGSTSFAWTDFGTDFSNPVIDARSEMPEPLTAVAPSVDTTAPGITVTSPTEGQHLAQGRAVSSAFTCADETGGSGVATCAGPGTVDTSVPGARTFSVTVTDVAGNSSTKTVNYIVDASADTTPPAIIITTPAEGQHFAQAAVVASAFSCSDAGGSGVVSCRGPAAVDTSAAGAKTFTVTVTDSAGNAGTRSVHYVVDPGGTTPTAPKVSLSGGASLIVPSSGEVSTTLKCVGTSSCTGTEALTVKSGARSRAARSKTKVTAIAKASYKVAAGKTAEIKLKLTPAGKKLLKKAHGKLKVTLTITPKNDGAKATTQTISLNSKKRGARPRPSPRSRWGTSLQRGTSGPLSARVAASSG